MTTCKETKGFLNAYVDGELDSAGSLAVETHIRACASCLSDVENLHALASAIENGSLRFKAPARLTRNVQGAIRAANPEARSSIFYWRWASVLASAVLIIALTWTVTTRWAKSSQETLLISDIVSSHVRSTMANHITDVSSSDSHTVKPWFAGKIPFTFNLPELQGSPFELVGGRVSYLEQAPGAELIFKVRKHLISVFIFQDRALRVDFSASEPNFGQSFQPESWKQGELHYFAIGDASLEDLRALRALLENAR